MAQTKKNNVSSRSIAKKQKNTSNTQQKRNTVVSREKSRGVKAAPYIIAVFAVLFAVCVVLGEGWIGGNVKNVLSGLFAAAAYLFPVFLLIRALLLKRDYEDRQITSRSVTLAVVFVLISMILHILGGGEPSINLVKFWNDGLNNVGGGVIGGLFGQLLFMCIGKTGSLIILFTAAVLLSLYTAGITPKGVFIYIAYKIKFAHEDRENRRIEREERNINEPTRRQLKEQEYLEYLKKKKELEQSRPEYQDNAYNKPSSPVITENTQVYRIQKKSKKNKNNDDERIKNSLEIMSSEEFSVDSDENIQIKVEDQPINEHIPSPEEKEEQLYNEAMAKTKARMDSQANDGATFEVSANDTLDAVGVAMLQMQVDSQNDSGEQNIPGDFDPTKIFVNPADASMIDRISEAANQKNINPQPEKETKTETPKPVHKAYKYPPIDILTKDPGVQDPGIKEELQENAVKLVDTLKSFKVNTKIENISRGPTMTRYELLPEAGTRVRQIVNLVDDISLNLATTGVRIEAPIPGKSAVGIEVPNKNRATVHLRTLIEDKQFKEAKSNLFVCLGENVAGEPVYFDIAKMPHILIAGATNSGKSVCLNSIITSILYKASPEDVKMILIDPKKVELNIYNGVGHLLVPVISDHKKAAGSLSWAVSEMERRYGLIEAVGVRDINSYNAAVKDDPDYEYLPRIVIVIDELADLMMVAPDDVETSICRIAQKARAAGMHLIVGTQRPSVDVITGLIKANIPSRIAFRTSSQIDSRTIIDIGSASNLIGQGDMLFAPVGALKPIRVQGAFVSENDVEEVVSYLKEVNNDSDNYSDEVANQIEREAQKCGVKKGSAFDADNAEDSEDEDPMLKNAIELAIEQGKISTSLMQRKLKLGYGRAAKIIDRMEQLGYVSAPDGSKPRDVLISRSDYMEMRLKDETPFN